LEDLFEDKIKDFSKIYENIDLEDMIYEYEEGKTKNF